MAEPMLKRGSEGPDVKDLQEALIALDFKPGEADGVFAVFTESAVKAFQKWAGAMADGIVGPDTWAKLDDADRSDPTLRDGSAGVAVRGLQRRLIAAGLDIDEIDGRFGSQTEAAVRAFQERSELDVDGSPARRPGSASTPSRSTVDPPPARTSGSAADGASAGA
jgi:peptidoglycan hydrolase-like protein with peptidoglycan-binding domain